MANTTPTLRVQRLHLLLLSRTRRPHPRHRRIFMTQNESAMRGYDA